MTVGGVPKIKKKCMVVMHGMPLTDGILIYPDNLVYCNKVTPVAAVLSESAVYDIHTHQMKAWRIMFVYLLF